MNFAVLDRPYLFEFRFNMKTGAMTETQISDVSSEFPVVRAMYNYEYNVSTNAPYRSTNRYSAEKVDLFGQLTSLLTDHRTVAPSDVSYRG